MKKAMIHLISEQAIPNILAIKRFQPNYICFLHSDDVRFVTILNNHINYINKNYNNVHIQSVVVDAHNPHSSHLAINQVLKEWTNIRMGEVIINVTGGTKLMAVGALQAGMENDCQVIYVNTAEREIINVTDEETLNGRSHTLPQMTIQDFMDLYGAILDQDKTKTANEQKNAWTNFVTYAMNHLEKWYDTALYFNLTKNRYTNWATGEFHAPIIINDKQRNRVIKPDQKILNILHQDHLLTKLQIKNRQIRFIRNNNLDVDWILQYGTPLELYVYKIVKDLDFVDDVKVSVEFSWDRSLTENKVNNEIDVMVSSNSTLTCISCKAGKLSTDALNELDTVARQIGGTFAKKIVVTTMKNFKHTRLIQRAQKLRIHVLAIEKLIKDPNLLLSKLL